MFDLTFKAYGHKAILIEWPQRIDDEILNDVSRMRNALTSTLNKSAEIVDVIAAYNSITIIHRNPVINLSRRIEILQKIYAQSTSQTLEQKYIYTVPVCYSTALARDLQNYMQTQNLDLDSVIRLHTETDYRVCFFGFIPGFMYLSGLQSELHCPRKSDPDLQVEKGAVAIGGGQTGIYPQQSPGGWHVIGMSPIEFIDMQTDSIGFAKPSDYIRFQSVSVDEYQKIKNKVENGEYALRREKFNA